jgi:hypothetical protein
MPFIRNALCLSVILIAFAMPSHAGTDELFSKVHEIPGYITQIRQIADASIEEAIDKDGNPQPPLTRDEIRSGVLPFEDVRRVIDRGVFSAYAKWCDFDWKNRSYLALMKKERASGQWTERQMVYMGLLHGITMGFMGDSITTVGNACGESDKSHIETYFGKLESQ